MLTRSTRLIRPFTTSSSLRALSRRVPRPAPSVSASSSKFARAQERRDSANALIPSTAALASVGVAAEQNLISNLPVSITNEPMGVLDNAKNVTEAVSLLSVAGFVVQRKLEMMNLLLGFEEANKYEILAADGSILGYLAEEDLGMKSTLLRNVLKTHRSFKSTVFGPDLKILLIIRRPFSYISSTITISVPGADGLESSETVIGEAQQEWHLIRRKMNFFVSRNDSMEQFAFTDAPFLAWDFPVKTETGQQIASINRNFSGFAREIFTDTGAYAIRFEGVAQELKDALPLPISDSQTAPVLDLATVPSMTLDQRAVLLAAAVSLDFDYFSRKSGGIGGGMMPMFIPIPSGGGGGTAEPVPGAEGEGPLPSTEQGEYGNEIENGGYGSGNAEGGYAGDTPASDWQNNGDAPMDDPWAAEPSAGEDGGGFSWTDLFPED